MSANRRPPFNAPLGTTSKNNGQMPLPIKISLPFVLMFLGLWGTGSTVLGQYFSNKLDRAQRAQAEESAALVKRELNRELDVLRRHAQLLAARAPIVESTARADRGALVDAILPLRSIMGTDLVTIFHADGQVLFSSRHRALKDTVVRDGSAIALATMGASIGTVVSSEKPGPPILLGVAPIQEERVAVGVATIGVALDDALLKQINDAIEEQIAVSVDNEVIASTVESLDSLEINWLEVAINNRSIDIEGEQFFTQPIRLEGSENERIELVLLLSQASLQRSKRALWMFILGVASLGVVLAIAIGYALARRIARPIQAITGVALQVVEESDFELRSTVETGDEIGVLSASLNQLIEWVGKYTEELEQAAKTLEVRVDERTQALSGTLAQLKETQSQLIQTEKMSSLGQMVAGIAHEINNPISFIQGNIQPLNGYFQDLLDLLSAYQAEYPKPSQAILEKQEAIELEFMLEDIDKILSSLKMGTQRVRDIVVSLRNFSRLDESTIKDVDLCEGLDSTLLILNHRIRQGVEVRKDYGSLPLVTCSPAQLNQVFTNIIANALDAMFEADSQPKVLEIATRLAGEDSVQVSIRDSGPGMSPEVKRKIFDPFFTTKEVGKGTGIGLGICFKIIEQHQGTIEVNTAVGEGTEFTIALPRVAQLPDLPETLQADVKQS